MHCFYPTKTAEEKGKTVVGVLKQRNITSVWHYKVRDQKQKSHIQETMTYLLWRWSSPLLPSIPSSDGRGEDSSWCFDKVYNHYVLSCKMQTLQQPVVLTIINNRSHKVWIHDLKQGHAYPMKSYLQFIAIVFYVGNGKCNGYLFPESVFVCDIIFFVSAIQLSPQYHRPHHVWFSSIGKKCNNRHK